MAKKYTVAGYDNFIKFMDELKSNAEQSVNILFTGSKDENGKSWCPDCVEAHPFIEQAVKDYGDQTIFISVDVGDRTFWKDPKNAFRTNKNTHLSVIPTIIRWKNPQRLEGDHCCNPDLLEMFFTDA